MQTFVRSLIVLSLAFLIGCVETTYLLGKVEDGKVDPALLGHWVFDSLGADANDRATLDVAKFDDHRYRLDWKALADNKAMHMVGHVTEVNGVSFVHAALLDADGRPGEKHYLIRFDRDGDDGITISNLDPEFFADSKVDSDAALRAFVEKNMNDPGMYVVDVMIGKKKAR